ncbi:hypothetical protein BDV28DRAFT_39305 [Aspergillus coremiiformis]|uniref:Uncharacterized protein n=1 Tax=Aspergillus coremiiformis TaxID=138285 RepID=A0A5N6Z0K0_9EURO|nr:hypothetical protein BDV28DRAFT_39305 [Aspergillus coremiiformis]
MYHGVRSSKRRYKRPSRHHHGITRHSIHLRITSRMQIANIYGIALLAAVAVHALPAPVAEESFSSRPLKKWEGVCIPDNAGGKCHHSSEGKHREWKCDSTHRCRKKNNKCYFNDVTFEVNCAA